MKLDIRRQSMTILTNVLIVINSVDTFSFKSCWWSFEYGNCIPSRKVRPPPPQKRGVLIMTLKYIWWLSFSSRALRRVEYLFVAFTASYTLTWSGSTG